MGTNLYPRGSGIYPYCDEIGKYEKLMKVGQGTFGEVYKARDRKTSRMVALKKILVENEQEGFPITALREIRILQNVRHENIVQLIEVVHTKSAGKGANGGPCYLVFEFCEHDLAGILTQVQFSLAEIKKVVQMLCNALYFLHFNRILHRDLKSANILVTKTGVLKLTDFGLARAVNLCSDPRRQRFTNRVVTLWYRPPELLLGERWYGPAIDMWGVGCIMAELWIRKPLLQGGTEQDQLNQIIQLCGSISPETWPDVENLEYYNKMKLRPGVKRLVKERLRTIVKDSLGLDLLDKLLILDPSQRFDADSTLNHDFFWTDPMPLDIRHTLSRLNFSLFELMTVRAKKKDDCVVNNSSCKNNSSKNNNRGKQQHQINGGNAGGELYDRVF